MSNERVPNTRIRARNVKRILPNDYVVELEPYEDYEFMGEPAHIAIGVGDAEPSGCYSARPYIPGAGLLLIRDWNPPTPSSRTTICAASDWPLPLLSVAEAERQKRQPKPYAPPAGPDAPSSIAGTILHAWQTSDVFDRCNTHVRVRTSDYDAWRLGANAASVRWSDGAAWGEVQRLLDVKLAGDVRVLELEGPPPARVNPATASIELRRAVIEEK